MATTTNTALTKSTDPLVWIDCEMTGLDHTTDTILSISCIVTTHDLQFLDEDQPPAAAKSSASAVVGGYHAVIATPADTLKNMSEWCVRTHGASGLTAACQSVAAIPASTAAEQLLAYIKRHVPEPRRALLAGNSVHVDKLFLIQPPWTPVVEWLHYRILDVSAVKEAVRRWCHQDVVDRVPRKKELHQAKEDILESIEEARYYMSILKGCVPESK